MDQLLVTNVYDQDWVTNDDKIGSAQATVVQFINELRRTRVNGKTARRGERIDDCGGCGLRGTVQVQLLLHPEKLQKLKGNSGDDEPIINAVGAQPAPDEGGRRRQCRRRQSGRNLPAGRLHCELEWTPLLKIAPQNSARERQQPKRERERCIVMIQVTWISLSKWSQFHKSEASWEESPLPALLLAGEIHTHHSVLRHGRTAMYFVLVKC
jgi:hypothetical protein